MATTETQSEFTLDTASLLAAEEGAQIVGRSPWALAWRRLRRNYVALASLGLFILICICCALGPVYAHHVAHTGPNDNHVADTFTRDGKQVNVLSKGGITQGPNGTTVFRPAGDPVGPQWFSAGGKFALGADLNGRDVAVRLLYGGINSLRSFAVFARDCSENVAFPIKLPFGLSANTSTSAATEFGLSNANPVNHGARSAQRSA